jgi:NADH-quinone oxidoreductase subunit L
VTVVFGFFETPFKNFIGGAPVVAEPPSWLHVVPLLIALAGVGLAWVEFGRKGAKQTGFVDRVPFLRRLFAERWYIDHFYRLLVDIVVDRGISQLCHQNDRKVIDGSIDGICEGTVESGWVVAFLQTGMIQYRLLAIFGVLALLVLCFYF